MEIKKTLYYQLPINPMQYSALCQGASVSVAFDLNPEDKIERMNLRLFIPPEEAPPKEKLLEDDNMLKVEEARPQTIDASH